MNKHIDPDWTMENDRQSVTVGINTRFWLLREQELQPTLIRLGKEHTRLFLQERHIWFIPKGPGSFAGKDLYWDHLNRQWCYSKAMIPIRFNDPQIYGIAVEGVPMPKRKSKRKAP